MAIFLLLLFPTRLATCKEIKLHSYKLCLCDMCCCSDSLKCVLVAGSKLDLIIMCDYLYHRAFSRCIADLLMNWSQWSNCVLYDVHWITLSHLITWRLIQVNLCGPMTYVFSAGIEDTITVCVWLHAECMIMYVSSWDQMLHWAVKHLMTMQSQHLPPGG